MLQVDRLYEAVAEKSPVCVGLDTDFSYIPAECVDKTLSKGENIFRFNRDIIEATRSVAGCFKVQIAYYEALGLDGMLAYKSTLEYLRREGLVAIADIKRGDIAKTAEMYAKAHLDGEFEADFVTLAPYMGLDSITPYTKYMTEKGKGVFVLCRTSNPGAKDYEYEKLADGHHGFVTDLLDPAKYTAVCTCGPEIMMEKVAKMCLRAGVRVYVSREAKMACGVGACLGCTCKSKNGGVSVCKDGPVFEGSVLYELD